MKLTSFFMLQLRAEKMRLLTWVYKEDIEEMGNFRTTDGEQFQHCNAPSILENQTSKYTHKSSLLIHIRWLKIRELELQWWHLIQCAPIMLHTQLHSTGLIHIKELIRNYQFIQNKINYKIIYNCTCWNLWNWRWMVEWMVMGKKVLIFVKLSV